jgi:hypothetical protein
MLRFITKHPDHVVTICFADMAHPAEIGAAQPLMLDLGQLPCMPNLKHLSFHHIHLVLGDAAGAAVMGSVQLSQLASVVTLEIAVCSVEGSGGVLGLLAQLPSLESLYVYYTCR